jgi:hypothetical protein
MYAGELDNGSKKFWLRMMLSSQSAILWMSVMFVISTVFYWIGLPAVRRRLQHRLQAVLGRRGAGLDRHDGALVRVLPDRRRRRPYPGVQPV